MSGDSARLIVRATSKYNIEQKPVNLFDYVYQGANYTYYIHTLETERYMIIKLRPVVSYARFFVYCNKLNTIHYAIFEPHIIQIL